MWLLLLVRMLIPFEVETPVSVYNYVPAPPEDSSYMPYLEQHWIPIPFYGNVPDASPAAVPDTTDISNKPLNNRHDNREGKVANTSGFNLSFGMALFFLWITGVLAFGIATIYKNCRFWLIVRREQRVTDKDILDLFSECKSTLGMQKKVEIIVTNSVKSPAIFGYFRPQILLPAHFLDTLKKDDLYCIFLHELGHVKRHDIGVSWLAALFQVIYWFNPLVWYAFHQLRADQEEACDAYVLSKIKQARPTDYARTIVNLLERFVQNRQLPSLAGIIENKTQIDRRISMILDYKRITKKVTLVSVLMLFIVAGVFFSCSNGRLTHRKSDIASIVQTEYSEMKHYKSDDWNFSLDIPKNWNISPSLPSYLANKGALISFGSNDNSLEALRIFIETYDPEVSLNEERDRFEKNQTGEGYGNFRSTETTIGSRKALIFDFDKKEKDGTLSVHHDYLIPYHSILYLLAFTTTRPDASFKLYDRIAETFEFHEAPVALGIKKYVSSDGNLTMEIPANWRTMPPYKKNNELVRFGTPQNGRTAVIYNPEYSPWKSLEDMRTRVQEIDLKWGWKDFTNSETAIGKDRKALIFDCNNGSTSARDYFIEDGDYKYIVAFFANTKNGIPADRLEEYDRIMKSIVIRKKSEVTGFEEYTGSDLKKPLASGMKRYISPDGDYTVDVPGDWRPYARDRGYGGIVCQFATSKNGLIAIFPPREYSPRLSLENMRIRLKEAATKAGYKDFTNSETVINGRKTLVLDSNIGSISIRDYFFEVKDYEYTVLFYAHSKNGIPADRLKVYEQVMKSINMIHAGPDHEKTTDSGTTRAGASPVQLQFRFGENKPGMGLEEMTDSLSHRKIYLHKESVLSNADIQEASARKTKDGFGIGITLTEAGGKKLAEITKNNIGRILGIVVDGKLVSAPTISAPITGGKAFILGNFTQEEAMRVVGGIVGKYTGSYLEKTTDSGTAQVGALPVQFRFCENKPGKGLEEMTNPFTNRKLYLHKESVLSKADIQEAFVRKTKDGFGIQVVLTEAGRKKFAEITKDNVGRLLAIVVNGRLLMAPKINTSITGGKVFVQGKFTLQEAERIARGMRGEK